MQCGLFLTAIWTFLMIQNGVRLSKALPSRQPGYLDFDNLPETNFTCEGKVIGGYYADVETGCQMFHVCTIGQKGDMTDIKFLCLNGTVFDQETRVCERVDEVDCSKSKDFYDLNLDLYNNGFSLQDEDSGSERQKSQGNIEDLEEELYDENYDSEESPETSSKGLSGATASTTTTTTTPESATTTPASATTTTTTTTTSTTPRPIVFSSIKPTFNIILPNLKSGNSASAIGGIFSSTTVRGKNVGDDITAVPPQQHPYSPYPDRNADAHLTGLLATKTVQFTPTERPFGFVTTQNYNGGQFKQRPPSSIDGRFKPPPPPPPSAPPSPSFKPYPTPTHSTTFKPPIFDPYKNHFFPSTPTPLGPIFINAFSGKSPQGLEEIRPTEVSKRPVVVLTHHFPTLGPPKPNYEELATYSASPSLPIVHPYVRQKIRPLNSRQPPHQHPYLQQIQRHNHHHQQQQKNQRLNQHSHKPNPTILALQSQQQKVHRLHQAGLEIAEHQIAQINSRNAEISNLRSQQKGEAEGYETGFSHRETKEIRAGDTSNFGKPSVAVVTSTSSTSSRVQKASSRSVPSAGPRNPASVRRINYKPETEYKTELEKLFTKTEDPKEEERDPDMDLEQLLLAWKLKTNQEVTREDIENVFARLDTSKFKNGQTISLSDIFNLTSDENDGEEGGEEEEEEEEGDGDGKEDGGKEKEDGGRRPKEETTRISPVSYDEYTEEDVAYDPFYKDVRRVPGGSVEERRKRDAESDARANESGSRLTGDAEEKWRHPRTAEEAAEFEIVPPNRKKQPIDAAEDEDETRAGNESRFSCGNKIPGGFYADMKTDCRSYHVCSESGTGSLVDEEFICEKGKKFDQLTRKCRMEKSVDCDSSEKYFLTKRKMADESKSRS